MDKYFLSSIVRSSDDSIVTVDFDLNVTSWNEAAGRLMGYTPEQAIGMPLTNLTLPEDFRELVDNVKKIREGGHVPIYDTERVKQDGEHIFLQIKLSPVKDDAGKVIGVATIARDQTAYRKAQAEAEKRRSLEKVVAAQEGERERISLELHDELGQHVTALRLKLKLIEDACSDEQTRAAVAEASEMALQIDNSISYIATELRPAPLKNKTFVTAVEDYLSLWTNHAGIPAKLRADGLRDARFGSMTESHLFRIFQESLTNALKHAGAESIEIQFQKRENENVMIIMDDGRGFDVADKMQNAQGLGLLGMRERAQVIGGSCEIESTIGEGTTIYVHFPENRDAPPADVG